MSIAIQLARALRDSGLVWHPSSADNFIIDRHEADDEIFTLSDMTVEAHVFETGTVLGFNGTTEWALDSVALDDALWLPREDQLRELVATAFTSLSRDADGYVVVATVDGTAREFRAADAADAYARALLAILDALVAD